MGLKTKKYEVKSMGIILPEAYAIVRETATCGDKGYAKIAVHITRELASNRLIKPYEEVRIDFTVDRNANDREVVYAIAKGKKLKKQFNHKTGLVEDVEELMPFYGWDDDIITKEVTNE